MHNVYNKYKIRPCPSLDCLFRANYFLIYAYILQSKTRTLKVLIEEGAKFLTLLAEPNSKFSVQITYD